VPEPLEQDLGQVEIPDTVEFALKNEEFGEDFRSYLKTLKL